jgi:hypothetical protein
MFDLAVGCERRSSAVNFSLEVRYPWTIVTRELPSFCLPLRTIGAYSVLHEPSRQLGPVRVVVGIPARGFRPPAMLLPRSRAAQPRPAPGLLERVV